MEKVENVVIIGSGPAGLTAAIYTARALLNPLVVSGYEAGGQLMLATVVENFPGFADGIEGPSLIENMRRQAERFGARFLPGDVVDVNFDTSPFKIVIEEKEIQTRTVIIATGASAKKLGIEKEDKLRGRGVSYCATCDGFFFNGKKVVVIGGGDVALEDALFLTRFAKEVNVIHRRDKLRASRVLQERAFKNEKIDFIWNKVVSDIIGEEKVEGVVLRDVGSGKESEIQCDGVFIAIGHKPNTEIFRGKIQLDEEGYIVTKDEVMTSIPGVFACGDVCDKKYKQAITAAGSGCKAAIEVENYLEKEGR